MFFLPVAMSKHAILLRQHAPNIGQDENLHLFRLFYQGEIR